MLYKDLRYYQKEVIEHCLNSNNNRLLYVLPTGTGKTVTFSKIIEKYLEQNKRVLVLSDVTLLTEQIKGVIKANYNLLVTTRQSYINRINFNPDVIIIDECHMVDFEKGQYKKIIEYHADSKIIGFTATPIRLGNRLIYGEKRIWKKIDYEKKSIDMIKEGFLSSYKVLIPQEFKDNYTLKANFTTEEASQIMQENYLLDLVIDSYKKFAKKKTLIFSCDIKHSELLKEKFLNNNILAKNIHAKQDKDTIKHTLKQFKTGDIDCLINVEMLTKGFDEPSIDTIILARPTHSVALHRQIVGRGLRLYSDKENCLIVDLVSNFNRNGDINEQLTERRKRNKEPYYVCSECFMVSFHDKKECLHCGYIEIVVKENLEKIDKEITRMTSDSYEERDYINHEYVKVLTVEASTGITAKKGEYLKIKIKTNKLDIEKHFTNSSRTMFKNFLTTLNIQYKEELSMYDNFKIKSLLNTYIKLTNY